LTDKFIAPRSTDNLRRRICFKTCSAIVQNQDSIERIIEDRFKLTFSGFQRVCGISVFPAVQHEETNVERIAATSLASKTAIRSPPSKHSKS